MTEIFPRVVLACGLALALHVVAPAAALAQPRDEASQRALVLVERGRLAYKEGRFDDAALLLKEAYAIKAEPVLLYNIARAHEGKGDLDKAIAEYDRYLATAAVPDRPQIEGKVAALRARVEETRRGEAAAADQAARDARERDARERDARRPTGEIPFSPPNLIPWVIASGGVLVIGAGAVVGVLALGEAPDGDASQVDAVDQQESAESLATVSTVLFIAGGVIAAAGVTWGVVDLTSTPSNGTVVGLRVGPTGGSLSGSF